VVAFLTSVVITVLLVAPIPWYANRRAPDARLTWGEAMAASVYIFFIFFFAYGVVPHQFIQWADAELGWRKDRFLTGPFGVLEVVPFDITYSALRDIMVVNIHVVFVGMHIYLWSYWQNRGRREPAPEPVSTYGRPLRKGVSA